MKALLLAVILAVASLVPASAGEPGSPSFPLLAGINIGAKNYDDPGYLRQLARLDAVILGFYRGWRPAGFTGDSQAAVSATVHALKALHPEILVGQYTVLNEARDDEQDSATLDLRDKLNASAWWLRNAAGQRVQWTPLYAAWDVNFTAWSAPDADGKRWPEWLADRNYEVFFRGGVFNIVYIDNVMGRPRVTADWDLDGRDDDPASAEVLTAYRAGQLAYWSRLRGRVPGALLVGNVDNDLDNAQWREQLDGAVLEALMGESWSIEAREGWPAMMARYRAVLANTRPPHLVVFNVSGSAADYRGFRYAYASCLMNDGYFSFTDRVSGYSGVSWFDEYDAALGRALDPPPRSAWRDGVWRRDFAGGVVLLNPSGEVRAVELEPGLRRIAGTQDPAVNNGEPLRQLVLPARDGIVLRRSD